MSWNTILKTALVLGLSAFGAGCDDGGDGDGDGAGGGGGTGSGCGLEGRTGESACSFGNSTCQAGQYCQDDAFCEPGCTSDLNCASNEFCEKDGEAVGVCARCATPMTGEGGAGGGQSGTGDCAGFAQTSVTCGLAPANQQAAFQTACEVGLAEGGEDAQALQLAIACFQAAGGDCAQVQACAGGGDGVGGAGGGGGGCMDDVDCDQTPGVTHQICSGGFCRIGCREDVDCGNDFVCDVEFDNTCFEDF